MTWAPRNKSEDEDEDEGDASRSKEENPDKAQDGTETSAEDEGISLHVDSLTDHSCSAESDGEKLPCRAGDPLCESGSECKDKFEDLEDEEDDEDECERDLVPPKPVTSSPLTGVEAPLLSPAPEAAPASSGAPPGGSPYSASPLLGRHLYYTSPFYGNYTNYGNLNAALQGQGLLRYNTAASSPGETLHAIPKAASDAGKAGSHSLESHYRPPGGGYEPKKDASEGCAVVGAGVQPYL